MRTSSDKQPVETEKKGDCHYGRGGLGQQQEADEDRRNSLKEKYPRIGR